MDFLPHSLDSTSARAFANNRASRFADNTIQRAPKLALAEMCPGMA